MNTLLKMKKPLHGASGEPGTNIFNNPFFFFFFFKRQGHAVAATDLGNANPPRSVRCAALLLANGGDELCAIKGQATFFGWCATELAPARQFRPWLYGAGWRRLPDVPARGSLRWHVAARSTAAVEPGAGGHTHISRAVKTLSEIPPAGELQDKNPPMMALGMCWLGGSRPPREAGLGARGHR